MYPNSCEHKPYVLHVTSRIGVQVSRNMLLLNSYFCQKPHISQFRIYGCKAYMHVPSKRGSRWMIEVKNAFSWVWYRKHLTLDDQEDRKDSNCS